MSRYELPDSIAADVQAGRHRESIGGMWDEIGALQLDFLVGQGMQPPHFLLDIGCGSMRGGVHFARYLEAGRLFGLDRNAVLIDAGFERELIPASLHEKAPRHHFHVTEDFDARLFGVAFDMAIAQSLFSHLRFNDIRACLDAVAEVMRPGGRFYATFFLAPDDHRFAAPFRHPRGGIATTGVADPYHYYARDLIAAADPRWWRAEILGDWGHPRDQQMAAFHRLP